MRSCRERSTAKLTMASVTGGRLLLTSSRAATTGRCAPAGLLAAEKSDLALHLEQLLVVLGLLLLERLLERRVVLRLAGRHLAVRHAVHARIAERWLAVRHVRAGSGSAKCMLLRLLLRRLRLPAERGHRLTVRRRIRKAGLRKVRPDRERHARRRPLTWSAGRCLRTQGVLTRCPRDGHRRRRHGASRGLGCRRSGRARWSLLLRLLLLLWLVRQMRTVRRAHRAPASSWPCDSSTGVETTPGAATSASSPAAARRLEAATR